MGKLLSRGLASCTHLASTHATHGKCFLAQLTRVQPTSPCPSVEEQHSHTLQGTSQTYIILFRRCIRSLCRDNLGMAKRNTHEAKGKKHRNCRGKNVQLKMDNKLVEGWLGEHLYQLFQKLKKTRVCRAGGG